MYLQIKWSRMFIKVVLVIQQFVTNFIKNKPDQKRMNLTCKKNLKVFTTHLLIIPAALIVNFIINQQKKLSLTFQ